MKYFVYCPDCGMEEFDTIEERDNAASDCIQHHLDDTWSEDVDGVVSGVIQERASKTDVTERPESLDDDLCDTDGLVWPIGIDYTCSYEMTKER